MKQIFIAIALLGMSYVPTFAQETEEKKKVIINIGGSDGVHVEANDKVYIGKKDDAKKKSGYKTSKAFILDIGWNTANDLTDYSNVRTTVAATTNPYTGTPGQKSAMTLDDWKSRNVNLMPFSYGFHIYKKAININTGLGFSFYNFSFDNEVDFQKDSIDYYRLSFGQNNNDIKKNKLAFNYITVPLSLQFKLGSGKKKLVIGGGASAGYLVKSWYKVKTDNNDKDKNRTNYAANPFLWNAIGEFGIDNKIRFYGSYALNSILERKMNYQPICFGVRFFGL